jgi:branched-chain amino acid transport system ATP-binding protein
MPDRPAGAATPATALPGAPRRMAPSRLDLRNLGVSFGGVSAVSEVSFTLGVGEILALIGPNGAGKTTIFNAISGLVPAQPCSVIEINGEDVARKGPEYRARKGLARTFQIPRLFASLTVFENLQAVARVPPDRLLGIARSCNIGQRLQARPGELTLPEQKQVEIARALVTGGNVLLLDEVAAGVAPDEAQRLVEMVRALVASLGISVIAIEHVMPVVERLSERVIVLAAGRVLAEGPLRELRENPEVIAAYFGKRRA